MANIGNFNERFRRDAGGASIGEGSLGDQLRPISVVSAARIAGMAMAWYARIGVA